MAFGWIREQPGGPVRVLATGPALAGGTDGVQTVLTLPAGAGAQRLPDGRAAALFAGVPCWVEPFTVAQVGEVALAQLGAQRSDSPKAQLATQRLSARHAELRQAATTGLWRVRFLAGGPSPPAAAQIAGLLCASADLDGLPYGLALTGRCAELAEILAGPAAAGRAQPAMASGPAWASPGGAATRQYAPDAFPRPLPRDDRDTNAPASPDVQPGYPVLEDLQATALQVVEEIGYGREITDSVRGFVTVRISSLRQGTTGRFLQGGHPLDFTGLLDANVVFEIEDTGDDRDKAFLTGTVLIRLAEHLRMRQRAEGPAAPRLRHLSVFEEAHRLLRQPSAGQAGGAAAHAVEMFAGLLAEIRAYGEGLIIAEQIPAKLIPDVIKNTAVKIVHRLPAADDRQTVGATINLTEDQSAYLVTLTPGEAAVFTDGMDYPILTRMPDGTTRETSQPSPAASPAALIVSRSLTCGPACQAEPCTLRQVRAALDDDRWLCDPYEPQWLAPPYQWALVLDSLRVLHRRDPQSGPHPRTAEWEAAYARAIPGTTCASQLQTVQRWYDTGQRDLTT